MTITFETDNDVIIYVFEKLISYARRTQQVFVASCIWWLASIVGLEQGLVAYIDNIQTRQKVIIVPETVPDKQKSLSPVPRDIHEDQRRDQVLKECEGFLKESGPLREISTLKSKGKNKKERINALASTKQLLKKDRKNPKQFKAIRLQTEFNTEGIAISEVEQRKAAGECLRCAWPSDRKGAHRVKDCLRPIKLDKGTARYLKGKEYQLEKVAAEASTNNKYKSSEKESSQESDSKDTSNE
jgi:hypothetical protein